MISKPASEFRHARTQLETAFHTRCMSCETCKECKGSLADHRYMVPDERLCRKCDALANRKECSICKKTLNKKLFPPAQWSWASKTKISRNWFLRCTACHRCNLCGEVRDSKHFPQASSACTQCCATKTCSVCGKRLERKDFGDSQWNKSGRESRNWTLRCIACHTCTKCGVEPL